MAFPSSEPEAGPRTTARGGRFARVAVNAGQPARAPFTYAVPPGMAAAAGQAVFVPFGPRVLQGIVLELVDDPGVEEPRPIAAVADPEPVLDGSHAALAQWMSEYYLAPLWDCVAACLPSGYGQKPVTMVSPVDVPPLLPVHPKEHAILRYLGEHGQSTLDSLREDVPGATLAVLKKLQEAGHLTVAQGLARPSGRARFERRLRLLRPPGDATAHADELAERRPRSIEARLLHLMAERGDVSLRAAREEANATPRHVARLVEEGWLEAYQRQVVRDPVSGMSFPEASPLVLTPAQARAADQVWTAGGTWLIHGITGSGKTEVYLDLVRRTLESGRGAIVLVPEISLTPQAIHRYGERFGHQLAVFHSKLSTGELYDQWYRVKHGEARVVVGSRSALFAPVQDLGLVVIDEEHEWTYKQVDPPPRYHARDAAAELCRLTGATLVLGSATPDIVTYHRAEQGRIGLATLDERVVPGEDGGTATGRLPESFIVDMREELKAGNRSVFSFALQKAVRAALAAGEQAILFVNRRGSARFILCRDCGYIPACPSCEVSMSLDLANAADPRVVCHHCGRSKRLEAMCPRCGSVRYRPFGVGTQRIEALARSEFKGARVARWDSDTAGRKGAHEQILRAVESHEVDILVGTQMLAKGLDLPAMTVVGIVDADVGLSLPDYHSDERVFQLLTQVSGRAGRRDAPGQVFIQTYNPEAPPIQFAALHDYRGFYEHEIAHRRRAGYPPFSRIVRLVHSHTGYERGLMEASRIANELRTRRDAAGRGEPEVLGPGRPYIARVRGRHRWQIVLRGRDPVSLVAPLRLGEGWTVDVDPANLL
jgi:primosomal protein N' (replication factor Y)